MYLVFNTGKTPERFISPNYNRVVQNRSARLIYTILVLSIIALVHQLLTLPSIPIMEIFTERNVEDLTNARETGYKLQTSLAVYLWHFTRMVFVPFLVVVYFIRYLDKRNVVTMTIFLAILFLGIVHNSLSGAKAPVAMIFLCLLLAYIMRQPNYKVVKPLLSLPLILSFPFFIEYLYSDKTLYESLGYFTHKVMNRFSYELFDRTLSYFDLFPLQHEFLSGATNRLFTLVTGNEYFNVQNYVFIERLGDDIKDHLLHGSANAHYIGYMYSDFGLLGVAFSSVIVGMTIGVVDIILSKRFDSPVGVSLYIVATFLFWKLMGSQPTTVLFSHGVLLCVVLGFIFNRLNRSKVGCK